MSTQATKPPNRGSDTQAAKNELVTEPYIKCNDKPVASLVLRSVLHFMVDQHSYLPDTFTLRLLDNNFKLIDGDTFALGDKIEIGILQKKDGKPIQLMVGEVTALEPDFMAGHSAHLVVRGYDRSHRLYRQAKSRAFVNMKDSDLAEKIAKESGLQAKVTPTTIVYNHIFQDNQTDLALLRERAWRIGYECFVRDETLYFESAEIDPQPTTTLIWGESLLQLQPRMRLSEHVDEVVVRGWDPLEQKPIIGKADKGTLVTGSEMSKNGKMGAFGRSKLVVADQLVLNQAEADLLAAARMNEVSGAVIEVEGSVHGHPEIHAGGTLEIKGLGKRYSGTYWVTAANHVFQMGSGLVTNFSIRGLRNGLLLDEMGSRSMQKRWNGVVLAVVTNSNDPDGNYRVKLKYPWLADDAESYWARVVTPGRSLAIPNVGDEVLVGFEQGDFNRPYVIGSMPKMKRASAKGDKTQSTMKTAPEKSKISEYSSPGGHKLSFDDNTGQQAVTLVSKNGHQVKIDDTKNQVVIETNNGYKLTLDDGSGKVQLEGSEIKLHSARNMHMESDGDININARGRVNLKGTQIHLN